MWKEYLKDYFVFTKKERTGIYLLMSIIIGLTILPMLFPLFVNDEFYDHSQFEREIATLLQDSARNQKIPAEDGEFEIDYGHWEDVRLEKNSAFYFDPNNTSAENWLKLGIRKKTVSTIQKFLSKGGRFNEPQDIRRIYGLSSKDAERLIPYVRISPISVRENPVQSVGFEKRDQKISGSEAFHPIEINEADSISLARLPGIGNRLANRIINYRNRLGGFYSAEQVGETYFLPDSTFRKILPFLTVNSIAIKKLDVNSASADELKSHPYIRYPLANAIVQYRLQHGPFTSIAEIKKIMIVTDSLFERVAPYLTTEQERDLIN